MTGPGDARPPEEISIDGLEIFIPPEPRGNSKYITSRPTRALLTTTRSCRSKQDGSRFHRANSPRRREILRTPELALNVADSPGQQPTTRPGRSTQSQSTKAGDLIFAELIVPKKTAYVGEIVPVQIRMGFDARVHPRLTEPPDITGQGFTAQKLQQSSQNLETINGRPFEVVTFKTAIAAARAGKFELRPRQSKGAGGRSAAKAKRAAFAFALRSIRSRRSVFGSLFLYSFAARWNVATSRSAVTLCGA